MKTTVTCKCGHTITIELFGENEERERKIAWQEGSLCPECYRAAQAKEAAKSASEDNLPELTGSEKQVAWAMRIRADRVKEARDLAEGTKARNARILALHPDKAEDAAKADAMVDESLAKILAWIRTETEARFWIDTRDETARDLFASHD